MTQRPSPAAGLPEGTVTFLFTDIEGSTRLATDLGDERWAEVLETHNELLRSAFDAHRGVEVKTEGDAFLVAFERATDAVGAALDGQRALEGHGWEERERLRVRMGLHTGEAVVREGDYVGHHVHRASRICDVAHGGQVLVSEATAALVSEGLPEGAALADLGVHRLKDLGGPGRLFGLEAPDLQRDFPPPRSLEGFPNNLPVQRSAFVGRDGEIARARKLFERHRLLTLTGVGGCGKTRLALQVGAEELDRHPDGVFFVDLAPLSDPELVPRTVADAVGLQLGEDPSRPLVDLLAKALTRRRCLLLLDNCEHLLDPCAELADRVLAACPDVRVLATSREPLDVEGEGVYRVPSLSLPEEGREREHSEAVALFVERAQAADPDFEIAAGGVETVAEICRRLDGIPLAIEFAAARVAHLSPEGIAERLDDRFRLLTGGRRRVRRQQTLEATLDWSHDLLEEGEQVLLRRLAVFSGSFRLEMAEEACTGEGLERGKVLDTLGSLVDKSLVVTETADGELRYRLLETVRSYAEERLRDAGEAETYRSRHRDAYLAWIETIPPDRLLLDAGLLGAVAEEHDNIRRALEWSHGEERRDLAGRIAGPLAGRWWWGSHFDEGHRWLLWALEDPTGLSDEQQAMCWASLAVCCMLRADGEARDHAARAVELGRPAPCGPLVLGSSLLAAMTSVGFELTRDPTFADEARRLHDLSVRTARELSPGWTIWASTFRAYTELLLGDVSAALDSAAAALGIGHDEPNLVHTMAAAILVASHHLLGETGAALEAAQRARASLGETAERMSGALSSQPPLQWIDLYLASAVAHAAAGDQATARKDLEEAVRLTDTHGFPPLVINECFIHAAGAAFHRGDAASACRLLAASQALEELERFAFRFRTSIAHRLYEHYGSLVQEALGPDEVRRCREEGRGMSLDGAISEALELADPSVPRAT